MIGWKSLLVVVLVVPVLGFAASRATRAHLEGEFRYAILRQHPDADPAAVRSLTLEGVCVGNPSEVAPLCTANRHLHWIDLASVVAAVLGVALVAGIGFAGQRARGNRLLLLRVFGPGLRLTGFALIALIAVHAAIAIAAIYYAETVMSGSLHVYILGAIGVGALVGIGIITDKVFVLMREVPIPVVGLPAERERVPALWACVDRIAAHVGALAPEQIVLGVEPDFFVTESSVDSMGGVHDGRTLVCSLPLMRILDRREFEAIVGHELGHYKGEDTRFSREFYPIYRRTSDSIRHLEQVGRHGAASFALMPAIAVFGYFLGAFARAESEIGRARELAADQEGAAASDAQCAATALVKVHAYAPHWGHVQQLVAEKLGAGEEYFNVSALFGSVVEEKAGQNAFDGLLDTRTTHPIDSHPPLGARLEALGVTLDRVAAAARIVRPESAAIDLIGDPEALEEAASERYQAIFATLLVPAPGPEASATA